jgi:hypothetical protein
MPAWAWGFARLRTATEFRGNGTRTESELRLAQAVLGGLQIRAGSAAFEIEARYVHSTSGTQVLKDSSIAPIAMTIGYRIPLR